MICGNCEEEAHEAYNELRGERVWYCPDCGHVVDIREEPRCS